ncbi:Arsenate reductase [Achromobacter denitrificans]|uniref:arsenate reductase ArsC n=1 Tax=Achromobacter denitrificans TaxID=32002 RepID=UPI00078706CD|nr:arsenate reductase ArsC [Achromobacter denitrificans]OLU07782.1 protein-tyrosine-phosphatase [Achromobacter denitrificans]QKH41127.1 arsenate reductase ArsC [Achromobacter denitrificans]QKH51728.1 arsenate reductase ArsC [Achromobacter denitrificans]CAB3720914.1 Arsenate reductase [Achromobacter denitrificans]SUU28005.1 Arsenate reductase [Achromobacter denitrificans]
MSHSPFNVLFLCTGNSARSILAEGLLNGLGGDQFRAYSAGSAPRGEVHSLALVTLASYSLPMDGYRSKSWDEFATAEAPKMDFIITVCDDAAGEVCPVWPGHPMTAHWGVPDPAAHEGSEEERLKAFHDAARTLKRRIELFLSLPLDRLDALSLQAELRGIGQSRG